MCCGQWGHKESIHDWATELSWVYFSVLLLSSLWLPLVLSYSFNVFVLSLCSFILLPSSVSNLMTVTLNPIRVNEICFTEVFFWSFILFFHLEDSLLFLQFAWLSVGFYAVDKKQKQNTTSSLEGVASCRRWVLSFNPALVHHSCLSDFVAIKVAIFNSSQ